MSNDADTPLASETFTVDDVDVSEKVREYDGYFKIDRYVLRHKKHEGGWTEPMSREIFERGHAVAVLLFDPDLDRVVLIEQFRAGSLAAFNSPWFKRETHTPWLLECVAGIIDEGETPQSVARRECLEEADCTVTDLFPIQHYLASPGGTSESIFLYCGRTDASNVGGVHGLDAEHEDIRVLSVPVETAFTWLDDGKFDNATTLIAMQWLRLNHGRIKAAWPPRPGR